MVVAFLQPHIMFWLYVWGPLRPFSYPEGALMPGSLTLLSICIISMAPLALRSSYFRTQPCERGGRTYELLGVRQFRKVVPDGDIANRMRRHKEPGYRLIRGRADLPALERRTVSGERSHMVLFIFGVCSASWAWQIGWVGWFVVLAIGNIVANVYPMMLQRYTRSGLAELRGR